MILRSPLRRPVATTAGRRPTPTPIPVSRRADSYDGGVTQFHYWSPRIYSFATPVSPSPLQHAVGQHWLACAMFIPADDQSVVRHYDGSLRNAFFTGNQRDVLGFCGDGRDWTTGYVSVCSLPHEFQVLASGVVGGGDVSRDELQRTCVQVAERLTALPDVTAAGALAVRVQSIENTGASFASDGGTVQAKLGCGISTVGNRRARRRSGGPRRLRHPLGLESCSESDTGVQARVEQISQTGQNGWLRSPPQGTTMTSLESAGSGPDAVGALPHETTGPGDRTARNLWGLVLIATFAGLGFTTVQIVEKITILKDPFTSLACDVNATLSCSNVLNAWQSSVLGPPNALIGAIMFAILASAAFAGMLGSAFSKPYVATCWGLAVFFLCFASWFMYETAFSIRALCLWCVGITTAVVLILRAR